jgi:HNH endonuclease
VTVRTYKPVWRCIYCGRDRTQVTLGKEHIIPFAFGGPLVLPRSSCTDCSNITRKFEGVCARAMFGAYRLAGNIPTRHPEERPTTLSINTHSGPGTEREEHRLPIAEYPIISAVVPELGPAGVLVGAPSTTEFKVNLKIINLMRDNDERKKWEAGEKQFEVSRTLMMTEFAQLLAKMAYSFAVAELGYGTFSSFLPPLILGDGQNAPLNLPDFVGGVSALGPNYDPFIGPTGSVVTQLIQHHLECEAVTANDGTTYLTVLIKFLQFISPPYRVVVAKTLAPPDR